MRELDPDYVALANTTTWFVDQGHVRAVQPMTGRDVILPAKHGAVWLLLEHGMRIGELTAEARKTEYRLEEAEIVEILRQLEQLQLVKIAHPCWVETGGDTET